MNFHKHTLGPCPAPQARCPPPEAPTLVRTPPQGLCGVHLCSGAAFLHPPLSPRGFSVLHTKGLFHHYIIFHRRRNHTAVARTLDLLLYWYFTLLFETMLSCYVNFRSHKTRICSWGCAYDEMSGILFKVTF